MTLHPFSTWANGGETGVSLYGALPANPSMSPSADFQPFFFTSLNPTILDSTLIGPNGQPQLYIITDSSLPGYTIFKTVNERNVALVEWSQRHAQVEVRGVVPKQPASQFLRLSRDRRFRIMTVGGQEYAWVPQDQNICMYRVGTYTASHLAILSKEGGLVKLELSPTVTSSNLLQPVVLAVMLLQGGRRID